MVAIRLGVKHNKKGLYFPVCFCRSLKVIDTRQSLNPVVIQHKLAITQQQWPTNAAQRVHLNPFRSNKN